VLRGCCVSWLVRGRGLLVFGAGWWLGFGVEISVSGALFFAGVGLLVVVGLVLGGFVLWAGVGCCCVGVW